jgi:hypothetical protein
MPSAWVSGRKRKATLRHVKAYGYCFEEWTFLYEFRELWMFFLSFSGFPQADGRCDAQAVAF